MKRKELFEQIKDSMRIKHDALNDVIQNDIDAGTLDLIRSGVQPYRKKNGEYVLAGNKKVLRNDALIGKALELYSKAQEDYQGKGEKYQKAYESLRDSLALCGDYNE